MTYSAQVVTAVTDIPSAISAFAFARGWTQASDTITRPGGGRAFDIRATIAGTNNREHRVFIEDNLDPTGRLVWTQMPWIDGVSGNPVVLTPTKLHLFGNNTPWAPEPFIACVIECGYNHYRHLYIGNAVKAGSYTGGELFCANMSSNSFIGNGGDKDFNDGVHKY